MTRVPRLPLLSECPAWPSSALVLGFWWATRRGTTIYFASERRELFEMMDRHA